jgi:hypothetical protein
MITVGIVGRAKNDAVNGSACVSVFAGHGNLCVPLPSLPDGGGHKRTVQNDRHTGASGFRLGLGAGTVSAGTDQSSQPPAEVAQGSLKFVDLPIKRTDGKRSGPYGLTEMRPPCYRLNL